MQVLWIAVLALLMLASGLAVANYSALPYYFRLVVGTVMIAAALFAFDLSVPYALCPDWTVAAYFAAAMFCLTFVGLGVVYMLARQAEVSSDTLRPVVRRHADRRIRSERPVMEVVDGADWQDATGVVAALSR